MSNFIRRVDRNGKVNNGWKFVSIEGDAITVSCIKCGQVKTVHRTWFDYDQMKPHDCQDYDRNGKWRYTVRVYEQSGFDKFKTAEELGVTPETVHYRLKRSKRQ